MIKIPVHFRHSDDIVEFVKIVSQYPFHMDLVSGNHAVDAKSLMGLLPWAALPGSL